MKRISLKKGFAAMPPEKRKAAGRKGGLKGLGHKWDSQSASKAGQKGGYAKHARQGATAAEGGELDGEEV